MADFTAELRPADPQGPTILTQERAQSHVNVDQLAKHLLHRNDFLARQAKILKVIETRPYFCKRNLLNLSRPERYHLGLARAKELRRLSIQHGWSIEDFKMAEYLTDEMAPYALQTVMFATSIREQCNDEQRAYWLPKVENWDIIGCYGQTELGHGSNVKGIECQARWNEKTRDFTIHSPTLTASKWWNGSLGRTANHAIVVAQLMLPDGDAGELKSHGPHQFIVQIRDMKTNKPLEGIVIGDIGAKYGYPAMDNGYMLFKNFRVPHSALLSRYSGVDSESGMYIKPTNQAVVYGSLTFVRAKIVHEARLMLARACTVAIRYTSIRRQFADKDDSSSIAPEQAVLNYPTVQIRLLPLLATTFALHYTGEAMYNLYWSTRAEIEKGGDFSKLAEMHAASSGLKSACTMLAADGIEVCRRAMGGHGFGGGSGMIPLNNDYLSKPTVEGDNWMITQQTASYLIKRMTRAVNGDRSDSDGQIDKQFQLYLKHRAGKTENEFDIHDSDEGIVHAFEHRVSYLSYQAYTARVERKQSWTSLMVYLHRLSRAFSESLLVSNFHHAVCSGTPDPPLDESTRRVMQTLFRLFALYTIEQSSTEFILSSALRTDQLHRLMPSIQRLMNEVRPHAVRLVDAWSVPDYLLESALGRYDGDVYNALFRRAHQENPLNLQTFNPDWKSEEIVMGEGESTARKRIEAIALGVEGHEQSVGRLKGRL